MLSGLTLVECSSYCYPLQDRLQITVFIEGTFIRNSRLYIPFDSDRLQSFFLPSRRSSLLIEHKEVLQE